MSEVTKGNLLIVEDEPEFNEILQEYLVDHADKVFSAANGIQALEIIQNNKINAILSDIFMPKMTGMELLQVIKEKHPKIPVIIMSAFNDKENLLKCFKLGALDLLEKPFPEKRVHSVVEVALKLGLHFDSRFANNENVTQDEISKAKKEFFSRLDMSKLKEIRNHGN